MIPMSVRLAHIEVFPIKSLDGVSVSEARVLDSGCLQHDRGFAMFDRDGRVINGKRTPLVHQLQATFDHDVTKVTFTDRRDGLSQTFTLAEDRAAIECFLSEQFAIPVTLRNDPVRGFPDDTDAPGPTVISIETLREAGEWFGLDVDNSRRRFRANLALEGGGPFWEDRLFGPPGEPVLFRIGDVLFFGTNPCARCVVPSRDPVSGEQRSGFAKIFAERRRSMLPDWADRDVFDHFYRLAVNTRLYSKSNEGLLRVGDPVEIVNG